MSLEPKVSGSTKKKVLYTVLVLLMIIGCTAVEIVRWSGTHRFYSGSVSVGFLTGLFGGYVETWETILYYFFGAPFIVFLFYFTVIAKGKSCVSGTWKKIILVLLALLALFSCPLILRFLRSGWVFRKLWDFLDVAKEVIVFLNIALTLTGLVLCLVKALPRLTADFYRGKASFALRLMLSRIGLLVLLAFSLAIFSAGILNVTGLFGQFSSLFFGSLNAVTLFKMCFCAPVFEEIGFRGLAMGKLKRTLPAWGAIIVSSLFFGAWHRNLPQFSYTVILGAIAALVYLYTDNLLYAMLLHFLFNLFSALAFSGSKSVLFSGIYRWIKNASTGKAIVLSVISAAVCVFCILLLRKLGKKKIAIQND